MKVLNGLVASTVLFTAIVLSNPAQSATKLFSNPDYDYVPSVIHDGDKQHFWWCGKGPGGDAIYYRNYTFSSKKWTSIRRVLGPSVNNWNQSPAGWRNTGWDKHHTCDPTVVKGVFWYNNVRYTHAMYYTAADNDLHISCSNGGTGTQNGVGVAYSKDGINWVKYPHSILQYQHGDWRAKAGGWGIGQQSVVKSNAGSGVWMWVLNIDQTSDNNCNTVKPAAWKLYHLSDSRSVQYRGTVSLNGIGGATRNLHQADFAYDPSDHSVWVATNRGGDESRIDVYNASWNDHLYGSWTYKGHVGKWHTGWNEKNANSGLLKDKYGNIHPDVVQVYFGSGSNSPDTWDLYWHKVMNK